MLALRIISPQKSEIEVGAESKHRSRNFSKITMSDLADLSHPPERILLPGLLKNTKQIFFDKSAKNHA